MTKLLAAAAVTLAMATPAISATLVTTHEYSKQNYLDLFNAMDSTVVENFEEFILSPGGNGQPDVFQAQPIETAVGDFYRVSGTGSGGTVKKPDPDLDGTKLAVRDGNVFGRSDTTAELFPELDNLNGQYLDSNDVVDLTWEVDLGGSLFKSLIFVMTDATDVNSTLKIIAGADEYTYTIPGKEYGNAERRIVKVDFGKFISSATIDFENSKKNDGLSIDDIAAHVAPVPLPASILLLGAGIAGLRLMRRKQKTA